MIKQDIDDKVPIIRMNEGGTHNHDYILTEDGKLMEASDYEKMYKASKREYRDFYVKCSRCNKTFKLSEMVQRNVTSTEIIDTNLKYERKAYRLYAEKTKKERSYVLCKECNKKKDKIESIILLIILISFVIACFLGNYISDNAETLIDLDFGRTFWASRLGAICLVLMFTWCLAYPTSIFLLLKTKTHSSQLTGAGWNLFRINEW